MSTGYNSQLLDELAMRRGLFGGGQEPMQRLDFNFADAGMGGAFSNPMLVPFLQPMINSMFGKGGVMPAQFSPQQGLYDQYRAKSYWQAHQAAMATASSADRETYVQMLRGMAQMRGTPWGLDQQRSANVMAGDIAFMAPMMAQAMPETFDQLHGTRGSATVMASFLHRGGLTAVDPVTGRTGVSGASAGALAADMNRRFFGTDYNMADWRGLSAGRAGALYDELQTRGLMGMSIGAMTPEERTAALTGSTTSRQDAVRLLQAQDPAKFAGLGAGGVGGADVTNAIKNLKADDPALDTLLRQFDANQIGNRLKSMSGAVAAMREIFGDMGRPNAPMSQLIEGLNSLTQGGLATMNPAELERTVRTTQVVARTSGMGMQAFQGLAAQGAALATQMGLDPRFGLTAAVGAAEFGAAYGQVGRGDIAAWGRLGRDELTLMDQQLRVQAAASPMATRLGAAMRLFETRSAAGGGGVTGPLAAMAAAIKSGASEFEIAPGQMQSLNMSEGRWRQIMADSGISPALADLHLRSPAAVQEQIDRYDIGSIARRQQPEETRRMLGQHFQEAVQGQIATSVADPARARAISEVAARAQAEALSNMAPDVRTNDARRNQALIEATRAAVTGMPGMNAAEFDRLFPASQLATMVSGGVSRIQQRLASDPAYQGYRGLHGLLDSGDKTVARRMAVIHQETAADVAMGTALGGLGMAGPLARLMDQIQKPSDTFGQAVKEVLGGVGPAEVRDRLARMALTPAGQAEISSNDRLKVVMHELMTTAKDYDIVTGTDEEKAAKRAGLTAYATALRAGNAQTAPMLRQALIDADLITEHDTANTVRAVAQQVMRGELGDDPLRSKVGGLAAAGGLATGAGVHERQVTILKEAGITSKDEVAKALAGGMNDDPRMAGVRAKLDEAGAMAGGVDALAAASKIAIGAHVGTRELSFVSSQRTLLATALARPLPSDAQGRADALADRERHARAVGEGGRSMISALLGDDAAMKNVGKGGFALARGAHEKQQEMARIAAKAGLNVTDILAGKAPKDTPQQQDAIAKVLGLDAEVGKDTAKLSRLMSRVDKFEPMTEAEQAELAKYKAEQTLPDEDRNKKLLDNILGKGAVGDAQRAEISKLIGTGDAGDAARHALDQGFSARKKLHELAGKRGLTVDQIKAEVQSGTALGRLMGTDKLSIDERDEAGKLLDTAGALAEGDTPNVKGALEQIHSRAATAREEASKAAAGVAGKIAFSGKVTVDMQNHTMDMAGATGTGMGSTPT